MLLQKSVVPPGLGAFDPFDPGLPSWAKLGRPCGAEIAGLFPLLLIGTEFRNRLAPWFLMIQCSDDSMIQSSPSSAHKTHHSGMFPHPKERGNLPVTFGLRKRLNLWFIACYTS